MTACRVNGQFRTTRMTATAAAIATKAPMIRHQRSNDDRSPPRGVLLAPAYLVILNVLDWRGRSQYYTILPQSTLLAVRLTTPPAWQVSYFSAQTTAILASPHTGLSARQDSYARNGSRKDQPPIGKESESCRIVSR